jgi:iron complex transport system substrate-binding protein
MMNRSKGSIIQWIVLLLLILALPCEAQDGASADRPRVAARDSAGRGISLSRPASRIVALSPGAAEMICKIGKVNSIIGRGADCDYPEALLALPLVGKPSDAPSADLVIVDGLDPPAGGIPKGASLFMYDPRSFRDLADAAMSLGELMGAKKEGVKVAAGITGAVSQVRNIIGRIPSTRYPRVFWQASVEPLRSYGSSSFFNALIAEAGGRNIFADRKEPLIEVQRDEVVARGPQIVIIFGPGLTMANSPFENLGTGNGNSRAGDSVKLLRIDVTQSARAGPRSAGLLLALASSFHPGVIP